MEPKRSNRARPAKSKKSSGENHQRFTHNKRGSKKKIKQDVLCTEYLQFQKCNYEGECKRHHLTLLDINTKTPRLCKNVFPHPEEVPYCQHVHITLPKHIMIEYLIKNKCTTCKAYNRKCKKIHDFELKRVLRNEYNYDYDSSSESEEDKTSPVAKPTITTEKSWADQVDEEEEKKIHGEQSFQNI